jgi:hypothetical protein
VRLYSRPDNDLTRRFPLIVETLAPLAGLAQNEKPGGTGREARSGGRIFCKRLSLRRAMEPEFPLYKAALVQTQTSIRFPFGVQPMLVIPIGYPGAFEIYFWHFGQRRRKANVLTMAVFDPTWRPEHPPGVYCSVEMCTVIMNPNLAPWSIE